MTIATTSTFSRSTSPGHAAGSDNAVSIELPADARFQVAIAPDAGNVKIPQVRYALPNALLPFSPALPAARQSLEAQDVRIVGSRPSAFTPQPASSASARRAIYAGAPDRCGKEKSGALEMEASRPGYRRAGYPSWPAEVTGNPAFAYPLMPVTVVHTGHAAPFPAGNPDSAVHALYTFITRHTMTVRIGNTVLYMKDATRLFQRPIGDISIDIARSHVNLLRDLVNAAANDASQLQRHELGDVVVACLQSVIKTVSHYKRQHDNLRAEEVPQHLLAIAKEDPAFRAALKVALNTMPHHQSKILDITLRLSAMPDELPSHFLRASKRKAEDVDVSDAKRRRTEDNRANLPPWLAREIRTDNPLPSSAVRSDPASFQVDATGEGSLAPTKTFDDLRTMDDVKRLFMRPKHDCGVERAKTLIDVMRDLVKAMLNGETHLQIDDINAVVGLGMASVLKTRRHFQALKDERNMNAATDYFIAVARQDPVFSKAMKTPLSLMPTQRRNNLSIMARMNALWLEQAANKADRCMTS